MGKSKSKFATFGYTDQEGFRLNYKYSKDHLNALKAGDFALVNPSGKHQYRNKGDQPFKMICGVPKQFE